MNKEIPAPIIAVALIAVVMVLGIFLYRGATGGVQGDGRTGKVEASPPIGPNAKQGLQQIYKH